MKRWSVIAALALSACAQSPSSPGGQAPSFRVDPNWPKPLPEENGVQLVLGQVAGIAVDERNGHVWIIHRPATLLADEWNPKESRPVTHRCCKSVPPVAEFDASGKDLRGWAPADPKAQWPKSEHGIYLDPQGHLWLAGHAAEGNPTPKFTPQGRVLRPIRRPRN